MDKKAYAVVYFLKENIYSEIPTSWLVNDDSCYWPKTVNSAWKIMQKGVEPDPVNWDVHQLRIVGYSSTLDNARKKAADSEFSTSNEDTQTAGRGRRKKKLQTWIPSSTDDSSDGERLTPPPTPKQKTFWPTLPSVAQDQQNDEGNSTNSDLVDRVSPIGGARKETIYPGNENKLHTSSAPNELHVIDIIAPSSPVTPLSSVQTKSICTEKSTHTSSAHDEVNSDNDTLTPLSPVTTIGGARDGAQIKTVRSEKFKHTSSAHDEVNSDNDTLTPSSPGADLTLRKIYEEIGKLRTICLSNKKYLNAIYTKLNSMELGPSSTGNETVLKIPLKTLQEIEEFELQLNDDTIKSDLIRRFKTQGGRDGRDHLYRGLVLLFTNEMATQCSWFGQRGNIKVKDLKSIKILSESIITQYPSISYSDIEKLAGEWFRLSRQRLNREMKKKDT